MLLLVRSSGPYQEGPLGWVTVTEKSLMSAQISAWVIRDCQVSTRKKA